MKTETDQYFAIVTIVAFIIVTMPLSAFAEKEGYVDHKALAHFHENKAKEMQAKIDEQIEVLGRKPRSSFFGKNGDEIRKRVNFRIDQFEQAAEENLQKAAFHKKMAEEQSNRPAYAGSGKTKG